MADRPTFLTTKGERRRATYHFDPFERYRTIAKGIYVWSGLPEDVPEGFVEQALFDYGAVSAKEVPGLGLSLFAITPKTFSIYGEPLSWLPTGLKAVPQSVSIMTESDNPALYLGPSTYSRIEIFAGILKSTVISLQQNIIALRQPIALDGNVGNSAEACIISTELEEGEMYIPVIDGERLGVKVLDLQAVDHTQSLISSYNAMDSEILSIMGIKNVGTEKLSGVTSEETTSMRQELSVVSNFGLMKRLEWCDKINARLGTNFSVFISGAYTQQDEDQDSVMDVFDNEESEPSKEPEEL